MPSNNNTAFNIIHGEIFRLYQVECPCLNAKLMSVGSVAVYTSCGAIIGG